jgi:hypothetical protein
MTRMLRKIITTLMFLSSPIYSMDESYYEPPQLIAEAKFDRLKSIEIDNYRKLLDVIVEEHKPITVEYINSQFPTWENYCEYLHCCYGIHFNEILWLKDQVNLYGHPWD